MLVILEQSIDIKAPPEKVWEQLALDRLSEWDEGTQKNAKSVKYTSEVYSPKDKYREGATAHFIDNKDKLMMTLTITESLEHEKMTYRMKGMFDGVITYKLDPIEQGTKFTYRADAKFRSALMNFAAKLFQSSNEKELGRSLANLKSILEK